MSRFHLLATWEGFCASCNDERPLLLVEHGPRGLRAWLSGTGPEDRELSYTCGLCGRVEHVPLSEAEDGEYDATLVRWPDWTEASQPLDLTASGPEPVAGVVVPVDVFSQAATRLAQAAPASPAPAPRRAVVHVVSLPVQRVSATDGRLLALAAA